MSRCPSVLDSRHSLALCTNPVADWLGVVGLLASPLTAAVGGHILEGGHVGFYNTCTEV